MPRTMRVEYPGAIYHVMDRGDRRELIARNGEGRRQRNRPRSRGGLTARAPAPKLALI